MSLTIEPRFQVVIRCDGVGARECNAQHAGGPEVNQCTAIWAAGSKALELGWEWSPAIVQWRCPLCIAWLTAQRSECGDGRRG